MGAGGKKRHQPFTLISPDVSGVQVFGDAGDIPPDGPDTPLPPEEWETERDKIVEQFNQRHAGRTELVPGDTWDDTTTRQFAIQLDRLMVEYPLDHPPRQVGDMTKLAPGRFGPGVMGAALAGLRLRTTQGRWVRDSQRSPMLVVHPGSFNPAVARNEHAAGGWSTGDVMSTLRHEYGHHVHYQAEFKLAVANNRATDGFFRDTQTLGPLLGTALSSPSAEPRRLLGRCAAEVSYYSGTSPAEAFAESFSEYTASPETCRPTARAIATTLIQTAFPQKHETT